MSDRADRAILDAAEAYRLVDEVNLLRARAERAEEQLADLKPKYEALAQEIDAHDQEAAYREAATTITAAYAPSLEEQLAARDRQLEAADALAQWVAWWLSARREEEQSKFSEMRARLDAYKAARTLLAQPAGEGAVEDVGNPDRSAV